MMMGLIGLYNTYNIGLATLNVFININNVYMYIFE